MLSRKSICYEEIRALVLKRRFWAEVKEGVLIFAFIAYFIKSPTNKMVDVSVWRSILKTKVFRLKIVWLYNFWRVHPSVWGWKQSLSPPNMPFWHKNYLSWRIYQNPADWRKALNFFFNCQNYHWKGRPVPGRELLPFNLRSITTKQSNVYFKLAGFPMNGFPASVFSEPRSPLLSSDAKLQLVYCLWSLL